jgi:Zn-dependent membrane protease YugP
MLIIPAIASLNIRIVYSKYAKINGKSDLTGFDVAKKILEKNGLDELYIVETQGYLTDAYDSSRKTVRLSSDIYHGTSISSIAVSAHECGHAIQDKEGYPWMRFRTMIFPVVSLGEKLAYIVLIIGLILSSFDLVLIAICLTALGLLFQLVTLPVEIDASRRAQKLLIEYGIIDSNEKSGIHSVLGAAAMTYVAGVLSSALDILYLLSMFDRRD